MSDYQHKLENSLRADDMRLVIDVMDRADALMSKVAPAITDASITVSRADGTALCEVWWDSENEEWLAEWNAWSIEA